MITLDEYDSPVQATVFNENLSNKGDKNHLSPLRHSVYGWCTNITFKLFSSEENCERSFRIYPENPCQRYGSSLTLNIKILACPVGLQLLEDRCVCDDKLLKFTQKYRILLIFLLELLNGGGTIFGFLVRIRGT